MRVYIQILPKLLHRVITRIGEVAQTYRINKGKKHEIDPPTLYKDLYMQRNM